MVLGKIGKMQIHMLDTMYLDLVFHNDKNLQLVIKLFELCLKKYSDNVI